MKSKSGIINPKLIIILAVIFILGLTYLFIFGNKKENSKVVSKTEYTQEDLAQAQTNTANAVSDLNNMIQINSLQWPVVQKITTQYSNLEKTITDKTDILFKNPETQNPELKIKIPDTNLVKDIDTKRLEITQSLDEWKKTIDAINSDSKTDTSTLQALVETAKQDIAEVKTYVQELEDILSKTTPENSGLPQTQLDEYKKSIESAVKDVKKEVAEITAIETSVNKPNTIQPNNPEVVQPEVQPIVTPAEIKAQEEVVAEAKQQEEVIQQEINRTASSTQETVTPIDTNTQNTGGNNTPIQYIDTSWPDQNTGNTPQTPKPIQGSSNL